MDKELGKQVERSVCLERDRAWQKTNRQKHTERGMLKKMVGKTIEQFGMAGTVPKEYRRQRWWELEGRYQQK